MRVILFETLDITDRALKASQESVQWNNVDGLLAPVRNITLANGDGKFSPKSQASIFSDGSYRNKFIEVFDDTDALTYKGLIEGVDESISEQGQSIVTIRSRDSLGSFLDWPVVAGSSVEATANASQTAGQNTIQIDNDAAGQAITVSAVVSPSYSRVPSYAVTSVTPSGGNIILTLDRGLEKDLAPSTIYAAMPEFTTIPKALKDALATPLLFYSLENLIGASFDALHDVEYAAGNLIRNFVRREENVSLSKHIGALLDMGGYYLTRDSQGVFDIVQGLAYSGEVLLEEIDDADIVGAVEVKDDDSRLLYGFSLPYLDGDEVKLIEYDLEQGYNPPDTPQFEAGLDSTLIEKYGARKVFKPISLTSNTASGYNYLFVGKTAAIYYGLKALRYAAYGRTQYRLNIKPFKSGNPNAPIDIVYLKRFLLTMNTDANQTFTREPCVVLGYDPRDESGLYRNVIIELTNKPTPDLPVP